MTVQDLFAAAHLAQEGPVKWGEAVEERRPGVYVIGLTSNPSDAAPEIELTCIPEAERDCWLSQQPVV